MPTSILKGTAKQAFRSKITYFIPIGIHTCNIKPNFAAYISIYNENRI